MFQPLRNTFCWYTWTCYTGAEDPSRIENNTCSYTQTFPRYVSQHGITIAWLAGRPADNTEVTCSNVWDGYKICLFFEKLLVSKIASAFKTHVRLFFQNEQIKIDFSDMQFLGDRSRYSQTFCRKHCSLNHWCRILILSGGTSALYLFQVSSGDFTTVEMNAIERTLNNSCSQSLARKRDSWKLEIMFSKHFSSGWI